MTDLGGFGIDEVMRRLPHRYPMLLVDRVLECVPGERIAALKNVTANELFFTGHFPGRPVMPGVIMLEALAQAAGILCFVTAGIYPDENVKFYFAGIDKARFRRPVVPGDQLGQRAVVAGPELEAPAHGRGGRVDGAVAQPALVAERQQRRAAEERQRHRCARQGPGHGFSDRPRRAARRLRRGRPGSSRPSRRWSNRRAPARGARSSRRRVAAAQRRSRGSGRAATGSGP